MKIKKNLIKILTLATSIAIGISVAVFNHASPSKVEAEQHINNYSAYTYSGDYYNWLTTESYSDGMNGSLRTTLTTKIKPQGFYTYSGTGTGKLSTQLQYADEDPTNSSNMVLFYSRDSITKTIATVNGQIQWNREHVWCKNLSNGNWSKDSGAEDDAGQDLLHIRPTYYGINSSRGDIPFGDINKSNPKYFDTETKKVTNDSSKLLYAYSNGTYFEPLDSLKGDIARIIMYVWTAYTGWVGKKTYNPLNITNIIQSYDTLIRWHTQDKPDALEGHRNDYAQISNQKNRNPFVDHPEFAWRIFGDAQGLSSSVKQACMEAYPSKQITPTGISLNKTSSTLRIGETVQLNASLTPSGASGSVTWTSSNSAVATVSNSGLVTGVAEGNATITATVNALSASCNITVDPSAPISPLDEIIDLDYTFLTLTGTEIAANDAMSKVGRNNSHITNVSLSKIYDGNGNGGALPSTAGLLKTGTSSMPGQINFTLNANANKVEILCHDFYKKTDPSSSNSNTVSVNDSDEQLAPYNADVTFETLTFYLDEPTDHITIDINKRIFIKEIKISYAPNSFTVTFNSNGGTSIAPQEVLGGHTVNEPEDPVKEFDGENFYTFVEWCTDSNLTTAYDFNTPVNDDLELFAKYSSRAVNPNDYLNNATSIATIHGHEDSGLQQRNDSLAFKDAGIGNAGSITDVAVGDVTINGAKAGNPNGNVPKYYSSDYTARLYKRNTLTFTSTFNITRIEFTFANDSVSTYLQADSGTLSDGVWTGESTEVVFSHATDENVQVKIKAVNIDYEKESTTVDNVAMRFGASIPVSDWTTINERWTITDYGVMFVRKDSLENVYHRDSVEQAFLHDDELFTVNKGSGQAPNPKEGKYTFKVKISVDDPDDYDIVIVAAPYIVAGGNYYFLKEMEYSVNTLADEYIDTEYEYLSDAALCVLAVA